MRTNLTILITGASKGIGKFLFEEFTKNGYRVYGTYHSTAVANEFLSKVDVSNYESVHGWISDLGSISNIVLINCAGLTDSTFLHKSNPDSWANVIQTNVIGTYNVIRATLPIMRSEKFGRIINFSSVVTKLPTPGISAYSCSKAAVLGLTKSLSVENGALGITTNALCLGYTEAGMGVNDVSTEYRAKVMEKIPVGRFCAPTEVYNTIEWIVETEYVNGSAIDINGAII